MPFLLALFISLLIFMGMTEFPILLIWIYYVLNLVLG